MAASTIRKHFLSLDKKRQLLDDLKSQHTPRTIANKYGVSLATVYNLKNNSTSIMRSWEDNPNTNRKRIRSSENEVNLAIYDFFVACRAKNIPISGPMLQTKALIIAKHLGMENFKASNGWLGKFKYRYGIEFRHLCGESAEVDSEFVINFKQKLPKLCEGYSSNDIFNCDETGLYYKQLPRGTLSEKGDSLKGGKLQKERLSILFCVSATGEKLKPLVIGKAACPRIFKTNKIILKNLPITWEHSRKAWMNNLIFLNWLEDTNKIMRKNGRKIILFMDNASSHSSGNLSNIKIVYLPPNTT